MCNNALKEANKVGSEQRRRRKFTLALHGVFLPDLQMLCSDCHWGNTSEVDLASHGGVQVTYSRHFVVLLTGSWEENHFKMAFT